MEKGARVTVCSILSATFPNFVLLCRYPLHDIFCMIGLVGVGCVSLKYQAKMASIKT